MYCCACFGYDYSAAARRRTGHRQQARVVEVTIRRRFIFLRGGAEGGRGTVYATAWKPDVAGRFAAGENRWSQTFGFCVRIGIIHENSEVPIHCIIF